jgi:hypothetical protein
MRLRVACQALVVVVVFITTALHASNMPLAADWPFIRGANYDGRSSETDPIDAFPPQGPAVVWTRPLGVGYSGFTTQGNRVYTQYQTLGGQYVICLDAATGQTIWEYRYELPYDPAGMYTGPRATPTIAREKIYFAAPSGLVGA